MQLTINVSEADFGTELKEIMNSLSQEEKKEIAKTVFLKTLNEVTDSHRTLIEKEQEVFKKIQDSLYSSSKSEYDTPEKMRKHYKYEEFMRVAKSPKEEAIAAILSTGVATFKELATQMVREDEGLKKIWNACSDQIREDFPKYIHDAMIYYFASHLGNMQSGIQHAVMQANNAAMSLENINRRLQQ